MTFLGSFGQPVCVADAVLGTVFFVFECAIHASMKIVALSQLTRFLNADLELESKRDLSMIVGSLNGELFALHEFCADGVYHVVLEGHYPAADADEVVRRIADAIGALPSAMRQEWDETSRRDLNIGIQAGPAPHSYELHLLPETLEAVAKIDVRIVITVYSLEP